MALGIIVSGTKREYLVRSETALFRCSVRKSLIYQSGPLFVGDRVEVEEEKTIVGRASRDNLLIRPRIANVGCGVVVTSTIDPAFSSYLLDKYLAYLTFSGVAPLIVFTKADRLSKEQLTLIEAQRSYYEKLGFKSFLVTIKEERAFDGLKRAIEGKTAVFIGQTGAGKSSALNTLDPRLNREVGEYSIALGRGKHQTKEVALFPYGSGLIGDTPGFSALELPLTKLELARSFPGFATSLGHCYYRDCLHLSERDCEVKSRVEKGDLSLESYGNYVKMIKEIKEGRR